MQDLVNAFIIPIIVALIGGAGVVIFEYYVIKPRTEVSIPRSSSMSRDWATAIRKGIKQFKSQQSDYDWKWWSFNRNNIIIESWNKEKGLLTLNLLVVGNYQTYEKPIPEVIQFVTKRQIIARFELAIDRTGDILRMNVLPVDTVSVGEPNVSGQEDIPETKFTISNIKQPIVHKSKGDVTVIIKFDIKNSGKAGKACPYIEYQVAVPNQQGKWILKPIRTSPMSFEIPALATKPITFENTFHAPEWPVVDSLDKIKIELFPCPDGV